jgi:hypothetical protein
LLGGLANAHSRDMKKRAAAAVLWFYAGWFVGAIVAFAAGLPPVLGPVLGVAAATFVAADPRHMIWTGPAAARTATPAVSATHTLNNAA